MAMTRCNGLRVGLMAIVAALAASLGGCGADGNGSRSTPTSTPTTAPTPTATAVANQPPVLAPIGDRTVVDGDDLLIALSAVDPEGQPVTFSIVGEPPENAYFLPVSGVFCIFSYASKAPVRVTFRASDGELSDEETVTFHLVPRDATAVGEPAAHLSLDPVGNHSVRAGQTLTLQLAASGAQPITYKMAPEPALVPLVTLDAASGRFQFAPTAAQVGKEFEITFQACVPDDAACSATAQTHETVYLSVEPAMASCPDYIPPGQCEEIMPGMPLPSLIGRPLGGSQCYVIRQAGSAPYVGRDVNIISGGALYIEEDPGKTIDVQVSSLLVEAGGVLQAGSPDCPFGARGGKLSIGLYGEDPSQQATVPNPPPGIQCQSNPMAHDAAAACFPDGRDPEHGSFYCTVSDSNDPCSATMPPQADPNNTLLEHYGNLNFDPTPWGYKVLGVSYGGSLRLFGYKGAKPLQDPAWGGQYDSDQHCVVPSPQQSTLGAAEMQAWADLSGSSWARLQQISPDRLVLVLDRVVSDWAPGDQIVVGTTDWYPSHSEVRTIRSISTAGTSSQLVLCRPTQGGTGPGGCAAERTAADGLDYPHFSELFDAAALNSQHGAEYTGPVNRSAADLRAPVGLLSRSIQIRSLGAMPQMQSSDPGFPEVADCLYGDGTLKPECYFGGHVMVRQGFRAAQFQGVEFKQLGQGGRIGHYPVHFHLAKSTAYTGGQAFLKDSAVWDSMTRFVTLHGTHGVTLARNVGYLSVGHGYYLEDGSEIDNLL
ncbi:MAG: G8 domain-containing protein, partial [Candidatus Binatia bacterium]